MVVGLFVRVCFLLISVIIIRECPQNLYLLQKINNNKINTVHQYLIIRTDAQKCSDMETVLGVMYNVYIGQF